MTTQEKLEKKGYKITYIISNSHVVAKKGQQTYMADNITQLYKKLFK